MIDLANLAKGLGSVVMPFSTRVVFDFVPLVGVDPGWEFVHGGHDDAGLFGPDPAGRHGVAQQRQGGVDDPPADRALREGGLGGADPAAGVGGGDGDDLPE